MTSSTCLLRSRSYEGLIITLCIAILYYCSGLLGFALSSQENWFSSLWAPSGVGLAMVMLYGFRIAVPGIILGELIISLHAGNPLSTIPVYLVGALIESCLAAKFLLKVGKGKFSFKDYQEIVAFFFLAVILAPIVAVGFEASLISVLDKGPMFTDPSEFLRFSLGNDLGVLIFTPLILTVSGLRRNIDFIKINVFEALFLISSLCYMMFFAFEHNRFFMIFPFFIWAALRFSYLGVSVCSLVIAVTSIYDTVQTTGLIEMYWIQAYVATCSITGHLLATVITAQKRIMEKEQESRINLKQRILAEEALGVLDQAILKSPIGFAMISRDFRFIRVNEFMAKINGYTSDFHTGKLIKEIIPVNAPYVEEAVNYVFETGESMLSVPVKVTPQKDPCKEYSGHVSYYPVRLPGTKDIFGVAIVFNDMTEEHKMEGMLRENQRWLNFAQEVGQMGVFECQFPTSTARWTTQLEMIYGLEKGQFDGRISTWLTFLHPDDLFNVNMAVRKLKIQNEASVEFRIIRKDGKVRWILCRGGAVRNSAGKLCGISGINVDITEQKITEQRLREAESELLGALEIRDEFFAIASHELKTPLTSLKLQIQLHERALKNNEPSSLSRAKVEQLLQRNYRQTERLGRLVDDMLDISRIRSGKFSLRRELCEIGTIVRDIVARNKEHFVMSGSGEPSIQIKGVAFGNWDPLRVEQVLANLISNAIRYGMGKPIRIAISHLEGIVRISIRDEGMGISEDEKDKIFERFERGSKLRDISGLGLGLFISRQIIEGHDGKIWVESEVNKGSTFHIELPTLRYSANVADSLEHILA